jgi:hypothetical protein
MQAVIPFAGFYYACHSEALDHAQEQALSDDSGESYTSTMLEAYALRERAARKYRTKG